MNALDLFSGIGGISYGLSGFFRTVGYCKIDEDCRKVLQRRMDDGSLDRAPIYSDVRLVNKEQCSNVDAILGGFPCVKVSRILGRGEASGMIEVNFSTRY